MANTFKFGNGEWAVGKETALAYNDENSNFKPLPFTFDRGSIGTVVNKDGLIETVGIDEPRIDFLNNTKGHLLLEPERRNSILYSNGFDNSAWEKGTGGTASAPVVSANQGISPDGTNNAFKIDFDLGGGTTSTDRSRLTENFTNTLTTDYTFSFYAKAYSQSDVGKVVNFSADNVTNENFNFTLTSDWQRFTSTGQSNGNNVNLHIQLRGNISTSDTASLLLFGFQAEVGSYATSYIPTQGSPETRSADFTKIVNSPILQGTNQFTLFFEAKDFLIVNGTNVSFSNLMLVFGAGESAYDSGTGIHIYDRTWFYYNGSSAVFVGVCYNGLVDSKFAISYDGTKFTRYAGGVKLGEYTASASMVNWDTITTGANTDVENDDRVFNLSDLRLYNTALTDAELIALTS